MLNKKALAASLSATAAKVYVEDVFNTYLYDGTGATQTITNGIDLSGKGGMVWIKARSAVASHGIFDTVRGATKSLTSSSSAIEATDATTLTSFNSNGFTLGAATLVNDSSRIYASWSFRETEKFFDVVTYTGNGSNRTISHNLGSIPGCIMVKSLNVDNSWYVYHRSEGNTKYLRLNSTDASTTDSTFWNNTTPTSTVFSLGTSTGVNETGTNYVAYLFAHDAGGFGDAGDQSVISCGGYTGDGTQARAINLGFEPQWILWKSSGYPSFTSETNWQIYDNMRGWLGNAAGSGGDSTYLVPNTSSPEAGENKISITPTGFTVGGASGGLTNVNGDTYIYIAIRRGPMKTPTDATKVFQPVVYTGTNVDNRLINTTIAPDFVMIRQRNDTVVDGMYTGARLTGQEYLLTGTTAAGATDADSFDAQIVSAVEYGNAFSSMSGVWVGNDATRKFNANTTTDNHIIEAFKRAPGFFDVVCYTGTGANRTVAHNLGVVPEMMWVKRRGAAQGWAVYSSAIGNTSYLQLSSNAAQASTTTHWNSTTPTSSVFTVGTDNDVNSSLNTGTYIAMLFASCPGVSKVGSFSHTDGTDTTVNCGFTNGVRYVLIKRTDGVSSWFVYDSARGIVAGNDPYLQLNDIAAEVTNNDGIDSISSGFTVVGAAGWATGSYIFLAIA